MDRSAKARGVYSEGEYRSCEDKKMKAEGMGPSAIAKAFKVGRASVYRALEG
jgi:transposase